MPSAQKSDVTEIGFLPPVWPKSCTCCKKKIDHDLWKTLPYVGIQRPFVVDMPELELRDCDECGSTLSIVIDATCNTHPTVVG